MSTPYHAKFLALELTRRAEFGSPEMFARALSDAQVDLNPHQVDAALFAARSPISQGAILADEVGLGKTIEAALLLAQRWAERRRKLLVIVPANLRKQWSQELHEKFHLPSLILERQTLQLEQAKGNFNPFEQKDRVVIVSYPFAVKCAAYIKHVKWDMVVLDEAHRLRNVHRRTAKNANIIKETLAGHFKVLLTATPLQNSLLELYGLVSIIDEFHFGSIEGFKQRYTAKGLKEPAELKERLKQVSKRTLRADVKQFVRFTERKALVQEFVPSDDEQELYQLVSDYLQRPRLYALPNQQRQLITMLLRKLLASSSFAIANTLGGLMKRLDKLIEKSQPSDEAPAEVAEDIDHFEEAAEDWDDEEESEKDDQPKRDRLLTAGELREAREEAEQLKRFRDLALCIRANSKGAALLTALQTGFAHAMQAQGLNGSFQKKAIVFTESRRTQDYLRELLESEEAGFRGKVVLFNGTNSDPQSIKIYEDWLRKHAGTDKISNSKTADIRAALVEYFRESAEIMLATEAAAEGINLQFCNLVVNYDLPWNPQRVEQRIGRCHRYGQKYDVVVVNFINKKNAADRRVYELLQSKFQLFESVFGASDQVLGQVDPTGVSFEKQIHKIYQSCRSSAEIEVAFRKLETDLEAQISEAKLKAREDLMSNFDQSVVEKIKIGAQNTLQTVERKLWQLTRFQLTAHAQFDDRAYEFELRSAVVDEVCTPTGKYVFRKTSSNSAHLYRVGHPLALHLIEQATDAATPTAELEFQVSRHDTVLAALRQLIGKQGWLEVTRISHVFSGNQTEEHVVVVGECDDGLVLEPEVARQFFECVAAQCAARCPSLSPAVADRLKNHREKESDRLFAELQQRTQKLLREEMGKLEAWEADQNADVESKWNDLNTKLQDLNHSIALSTNPLEELELEEKKISLLSIIDREAARVREQKIQICEKKLNIVRQKKRMLSATRSAEVHFTIRWKAL